MLDPNQNKIEFTFDKAGHCLTETNANSTIRYEYNNQGLISKMTNGRGQVTTVLYDEAGRVTSITDLLGTISYTYDANSNVLTTKENGKTITRSYDALNRITEYTDGNGKTIKYGYNAVGNLISLTYPNNKTVDYVFDATNRMTQVTDMSGRITRYEYDAASRLSKTIRPDGSIETRTYDDAGQLIQIKNINKTGEIINQYDLTYNAAGNITEEKSTIPEVTYIPGSAIMTYTGGNRLESYNEQPVTYDQDGNMTRGPLQGNINDNMYDARNRLISAGSLSYSYDAENNRIGINSDGQTTNFVINPNAVLSQVLVREDSTGTETYYIYGLGLIGQENPDGAYQNYHYDLRGSAIVITDQTGQVTDTFAYDPYGLLVAHQGQTDTPFLYNGQYGVMTDSNGLYHMRARYYNPEIKRFVNQDILLGNIDDGQSLNRYAYVNGCPVFLVDPNGELPTVLIGAVAGGIIGGITAVAVEYITNRGQIDKISIRNVITGTVAGAASGALAGTGVGLVGQIAGNMAISGVSSRIMKPNESWGDTAISTMVGGLGGYLGGPGARTAARQAKQFADKSKVMKDLYSGIAISNIPSVGYNIVTGVHARSVDGRK